MFRGRKQYRKLGTMPVVGLIPPFVGDRNHDDAVFEGGGLTKSLLDVISSRP